MFSLESKLSTSLLFCYNNKELKEEKMRHIYTIRQILVSFVACLFLTWAFFKNEFFGKIVISPFWVCSFAIFWENIFLLFNKNRVARVFKYIFRISFFVYVFGFLLYSIYFAILNKIYSLFIVIGIFLLATIPFFKATFLKKKKKNGGRK